MLTTDYNLCKIKILSKIITIINDKSTVNEC